MKFCIVLFVSVFATSMALPARTANYPQPSFYYQSNDSPHRLMYLQYVHQPSSSRSNSRLTNTAAAFVAGETVASGTYVTSDVSGEQQIAEESVLDNAEVNVAESVDAAAVVEAEEAKSVGILDTEVAGAADVAAQEVPEVVETPEETQVVLDEAAPVAEDLPSEDGEKKLLEVPVVAEPEPAVAVAAEASVPDDNKPIIVNLSEEAQNDEDDEEDEDEEEDNVLENSRPKAASNASPAGNFFPINFGGTNGGAIAVANSFSTGAGGSAKSQSIAYGSVQKSKSNRRRH